MADVLETLRRTARTEWTRILLPEAHDERVLMAAARIAEEDIATPVVFGPDQETERLCEEHDVTTAGIEFLPYPEGDELAEYARTYADLRDVDLDVARTLLSDPLVLGSLLARLDEVDGLVAGAAHPTAEVVATANGVVGLDPAVDTASSYFIMVFDDPAVGEDGMMLYADCGVNINPDAERLADIAVSTADSAETLLDWTPRMAMLSFSTRGSAEHPDSEKVATATDLAADRIDSGVVDGEVQADVALVPEVARRKVPTDRRVTGDANILIFPDLDAGNIAYKLTERLAGAKALGPVLQGYARPVSDLSRGASVEDIVDIATITAVQAAGESEVEGSVVSRGLLARRESEAAEE